MQDTSVLKIVEAREEHIPFVAWVQLAASRSHLPLGMWDLYIGGTEQEALRYIEAIASTETRHFGHYTNFIIAEVDGKPAAGLSGYFEADLGVPKLVAGMDEANRKLGVTPEQNEAGWARAGSIALLPTNHVPNAWIVEWVATAPDCRRRGLVDKLMAEILDVGRKKGASTADIGVLIGNDPAQAAYEKNGFEVIDEQRNAAFEAAYGSPGIRLLRRQI